MWIQPWAFRGVPCHSTSAGPWPGRPQRGHGGHGGHAQAARQGQPRQPRRTAHVSSAPIHYRRCEGEISMNNWPYCQRGGALPDGNWKLSVAGAALARGRGDPALPPASSTAPGPPATASIPCQHTGMPILCETHLTHGTWLEAAGTLKDIGLCSTGTRPWLYRLHVPRPAAGVPPVPHCSRDRHSQCGRAWPGLAWPWVEPIGRSAAK